MYIVVERAHWSIGTILKNQAGLSGEERARKFSSGHQFRNNHQTTPRAREHIGRYTKLDGIAAKGTMASHPLPFILAGRVTR